MVTKVETAHEPVIRHIAFIMDGNGRWAKKRGMPREYGHKRGAEVFKTIMRYCASIGIEASTFYVFSTENWKRPKHEVDAIMKLLSQYLRRNRRARLQRCPTCRAVYPSTEGAVAGICVLANRTGAGVLQGVVTCCRCGTRHV